ncbi:MAG: hypothetical protein PHN56_02590 [Candidatus Nanoarchaeia archaeon]|nr:hypothetical protein [Candidatus Nanoarchaeia archaeon]
MTEKFIDDAKYFATKGDVKKTESYIDKAKDAESEFRWFYSSLEKKILSDAKYNHANNRIKESEKYFEKNNPFSALISLEDANYYSIGLKQKLDVHKRIKVAKQQIISYYMDIAKGYSMKGEENSLEETLLEIRKISLIKFFKVKEDLRYECAEKEFRFKLVCAKNKAEKDLDGSYEALALNIPSIQFHAKCHKIDFKSNELFNITLDFLLAKEAERLNKLKEMLPTVEKSKEKNLHKELFKSANILNQYSDRLEKKFDKGFDFEEEILQIDEYSKIAPAMSNIFD